MFHLSLGVPLHLVGPPAGLGKAHPSEWLEIYNLFLSDGQETKDFPFPVLLLLPGERVALTSNSLTSWFCSFQ